MQEFKINIARNIDIKYGLAYNLIKHINVENNQIILSCTKYFY